MTGQDAASIGGWPTGGSVLDTGGDSTLPSRVAQAKLEIRSPQMARSIFIREGMIFPLLWPSVAQALFGCILGIN
jgi:hypothetical protein